MCRLVLGMAVLAGLAGCLQRRAECVIDGDCDGGDVCANTHVCVTAAQVHRVVVRWTVAGNPASAATCAPIPELSLSVLDDDSSDRSDYAPVPCATGMFTF